MTSRRSSRKPAAERLPPCASPEDGLAMAEAYADAGLFETALGTVRGVLAAHPDHQRAHVWLAFCLHRLARYGEAEAAAREALRLDPNDAGAHRWLGIALRASGTRFPEAAAHLDTAIRLAPADPWGHYERAVLFTRMRRTRQAVADIAAAAAQAPDNAGLLAGAAESLLSLLRPREARDYAARAFACGPDNPKALVVEAKFRLYAGRHREAHDLAQAALVLGQPTPDMLACLIEARMCRNPVFRMWSRALNWARLGRARPPIGALAVVSVFLLLVICESALSPYGPLVTLGLWFCLLGSLVACCQVHQRRYEAAQRPVRLRRRF